MSDKKVIHAKITPVTIEEGELEGTRVTWKRSVSTRIMRELKEAFQQLDDHEPADDASVADSFGPVVEVHERICEILAPRLHSWNLADEDGNDLPPTQASLEELDQTHLLELMNSFIGLMGELPKAQEGESSSSDTQAIPATSPSS